MTSASTKITIHVIVIRLLYTVTQWYALECSIGIDWPAVQRTYETKTSWMKIIIPASFVLMLFLVKMTSQTSDAYTKRMGLSMLHGHINTASNALERKKNIVIKRYSRKMCIYPYTYKRIRSLFAAFKMIYINLLFININHKGLYGLKYTNTYSCITSYYVNARERENVKEIRIRNTAVITIISNININ